MADIIYTIGADSSGLEEEMGKVKRHAVDMSGLMGQIEEFGKGIGYTIGAWNLGFEIAEKTVDAIKSALQDIAQTQTATVQFQSFVTNANETIDALGQLKSIAPQTATNIKDLAPALASLGKYGIQGQPAVDTVKNLSEFAKAAHIPLLQLTETYAHLSEHQASMTEMLNTSTLLPERIQKAVQAYHQFVIDAPMFEMHEQRRIQMQDRRIEHEERERDAQIGFVDKIGLGQRLSTAYMAPRGIAEEPREPILMPGMIELEDKFWTEMHLGMEQLQTDTGLSETQLRNYFATGQIGEKDLLEAAGRRHQAEKIAIKEADEDARYKRQEGQMTTLITLQGQMATGLQNSANIQQQFMHWSETIEGKFEMAAEHIAEMAQGSKTLLEIMTKWATAIDAGVTALGKGADIYNKWGEKASQKFQKWEERIGISPSLIAGAGAVAGMAPQDQQRLHDATERNNRLMEEQNELLRRGLIGE